MRKILLVATILLPFVASCGGGPPAEQPAPSTPASTPAPATPAPTPAPEPAKPAETQAAPANTNTPAPASPAPATTAGKPAAAERPAFTRTDLQAGTGRNAQKGTRLQVHYTGWLYDPSKPGMKGRMFDTSKERGPFDFVLGAGQVIPGWDQGFDGMKVGGRRRLIIPSDLAYGRDGAGNGIIPPDAVLLFEMELLDVQ